MAPLEGSFRHEGHRLTYDVYGEGEQTIVLVHGLLMNRRMYERLGSELASRGVRAVAVDLLGHGRSDRPIDARAYSMPAFGDQIAAFCDHLELEAPVVGGTSLGANATLEFAVHHPGRAGGLFIEMPVLDNALLGAALAFTPMLVALRFGGPLLKLLAAAANRIPRTSNLVDIGLDWVRQDPDASRAVLEGLFFDRTAPPRSERLRITEPALIVGHPSDPLHPFSDADMLVEEMPNARLIDANSILEWRLRPGRLDDQLAGFLDDLELAGPARAAA